MWTLPRQCPQEERKASPSWCGCKRAMVDWRQRWAGRPKGRNRRILIVIFVGKRIRTVGRGLKWVKQRLGKVVDKMRTGKRLLLGRGDCLRRRGARTSTNGGTCRW